jgi:hypothetical protein
MLAGIWYVRGNSMTAQATGHDVNTATVTGATAAASIYSIFRMFAKK